MKVSDYVKLQIDTLPVVNAITNHSGEYLNTAGWSLDKGDLRAAFGPVLNAVSSGASPSILESPSFGVAVGQWVGARYDAGSFSQIGATGHTIAAAPVFYNADGALINAPSYPAATTIDTGGSTSLLTNLGSTIMQAPAGTAYARVRFRLVYPGTNTTETFFVKRVMVAVADTMAGATGVAFAAPLWLDILGDSVSVKITRGGEARGAVDEIDVGTLSAVVLGASYSPATNTYMRPGRAVRVLAATPSAPNTWVPLFTGALDKADLVLGEDKLHPGRARITMTAVDAIPGLRGIASPSGYSATSDAREKLRALMANSPACGLNDNAVGYIAPSTTTNSYDANATLWDQLVAVRNTYPGSDLFIDKDGWVQWKPSEPTTPDVTFSGDSGGTPSFVDLDLGFASDALVNELTISRTHMSEEDGEKVYGPYLNQRSAQIWRKIADEVEVSDGDPATLAGAYLQQLATPSLHPRSMTFRGLDTGAALRDLYTVVKVILTSAGLTSAGAPRVTVTGIDHDITPGRWLVTWRLRPSWPASPFAVVVKNPPGGANSGPDDVLPPTAGILGSRVQTTAQTLAAINTFYAVDFNTALTMDGSITWDTTNKRFVVPKAGRYHVGGQVTFSASATGRRVIRVLVNGAIPGGFGNGQVESTPGAQLHSIPYPGRVLKLAAGDTLTMQAYQGAAANFALSVAGTWMDVAWVGD